MGRVRRRKEYLRIKKNTHELPCDILTLLLKESKSAGLKKEKDRGEEKLRIFKINDGGVAHR
jgi:hypothetical protein